MKKSKLNIAAIALIAGALTVGCNPSSDRGSNSRDNNRNNNNSEDAIGNTQNTTGSTSQDGRIRDSQDANPRKDLGGGNQQHHSELDDYRTSTSERLNANDRLIADHKTRSANDNSANKATNDKKFAELERRNTEMKTKLKDYRSDDNNSNWNEFKRDFDRDMEALERDFKNSTSGSNN